MTRRSYHVEPNENPLTRGTHPWQVVCLDDGWSLPCRTWQAAIRHADILNAHDTVPAAVAVSPTLVA
jgi:hypothetical protein